MKVLLREHHDTLGEVGTVVTVADGYARNFLIPRKIAMPVTKGNLRVIEEEKKQQELRRNKEKAAAQELAAAIAKLSLTVPMKVGEEDRVFGSVTPQQIAELLKEKGYEIDRKKILLDEPIKALGIYPVKIKIQPDVDTEVKVWVVRE